MVPAMRMTALSIALITVGACGGGGGGGGGGSSGPPAIEVPFTSFNAITANQTVAMNATAITANFSGQVDAGGSITFNSFEFTEQGAGTVRLTYDGSRALSGINISTPQPNSSVSFNRGSVICDGGGTCEASNPTASGLAIDPFVLNWNYQTFGVWGIETSPTTGVFGALSAGTPTTGAALPREGIFEFRGLTAGVLSDNLGIPHATAASMTANVDFANRSIVFATSNTVLANINNPNLPLVEVSALNLNGTLRYEPGVNSFSGPVTTAHTTPTDRLGGTASGRFYGPAAEEMGGVYTLRHNDPNNLSRMIGGFGAKR